MQVASTHQMPVPLSLLVLTHGLQPSADALLGTTSGFSRDTWVLERDLPEISHLSLKLTPAPPLIPLGFWGRSLCIYHRGRRWLKPVFGEGFGSMAGGCFWVQGEWCTRSSNCFPRGLLRRDF